MFLHFDNAAEIYESTWKLFISIKNGKNFWISVVKIRDNEENYDSQKIYDDKENNNSVKSLNIEFIDLKADKNTILLKMIWQIVPEH